MATEENALESTKQFRFNSIWFVPLVSLIVAGWMFYVDWSDQGIEITIIADDAEGLEAGKTKLKARNVELGTVTQITLSDNYEHAVITLQVQKDTAPLMTENTQFWVVKPRVGREGVSGLGTLLSGAYIHMEPSQVGKRQTTFTILPQPPLSKPEDKGLRIRLFSKNNAEMDIGTPVHFRGFQVGYIESVEFDTTRQSINYRVFIKAPYNAMVTNAVEFWVTPGLSFEGSAKGFEVRMDSLETLIAGGISFGVVATNVVPQPVADLTEFQLYATKQQAVELKYSQHIGYIALFRGNIGGLEAGAPVELNGLRIGTVAEVPFSGMSLETLSQYSTPRIPVLINIEPQRFSTRFKGGQLSRDEWQQKLNEGFKAGMRATIASSNLLTGAKLVAVSYSKDVKDYQLEYYEQYPIFPTTNTSLASLQNKVESLLDKIMLLPVDETFNELNATLATTNQTMAALHDIGARVDDLLAQQATQALPAELQRSLSALQEMLSSYQTQGEIGQSLNQTLLILQQNLEDLQPLLQQLKEKPNSLILGKPIVTDQAPKAGVQD